MCVMIVRIVRNVLNDKCLHHGTLTAKGNPEITISRNITKYKSKGKTDKRASKYATNPF